MHPGFQVEQHENRSVLGDPKVMAVVSVLLSMKYIGGISLVVLFYRVSTLLGSFNAELSHFDSVLWHINHRRLFNANPFLYL